jgi:uncharacterized DUF497 family protein
MHSDVMFEWDAAKRDRNLARHRLDLTDAQLLFDGRPVVSTPSPRNGEKFYSAVWTERGEAIRLISFRRARDGEERGNRARLGRRD